MITTSLSRISNNYKAAFPNAVGEIKNFNVSGNRISFELHFYADEEARQLLIGVDMPNMDSGVVMRQHYSEEVSVIEAYKDDAISTSPTEILKECCEFWLKDKHYPQA